MAELSSQERKKLPSKDFIFPKTKGYPIPDKEHAEYALGASHGARSGKPASSSKQEKIRRAVFSKYPSLKKGHEKKRPKHRGGMVHLSSLRRAA